MSMHNLDIARVFEELADILELKRANPFRVRSYRRAAQAVSSAHFDVCQAVQDDPGRVRSIPGIGPGSFKKIKEIAETGGCAEHQRLRSESPPSLLPLLQLKSLGPRKIALFWEKLNISNLQELEQAVKDQRIRELPGMGPKSEARILAAIEEFRRREGRFRLDYGSQISQSLLKSLQSSSPLMQAAAAGSVRRRKETVGDVDILVTTEAPDEVIADFVRHPDAREILARGETKASFLTRVGLQVDLRVVEDECFGAALQYFTGSQQHNVALRERAKRMGYKVSEYGIFDVGSGNRVAGRTEEEIYGLLKLDFIPPELRENRGEIEKAESGELPNLIRLEHIRGDLHMHTTASDGRNTLEQMVSAGRQAGYEYIAVTDHSHSLAMVEGLDEEKLLSQIEAVDRLNRTNPGITVLKGIEVDILADGSLDLDQDVLSQLDLVIASVHSRFSLSRKEMTRRITRALEVPAVNVLAHPTGRLVVRRDPYDIDMETVVRAAVQNRVCLELNAYPARLDLSDVHCRMARDMGALITINSDSHSSRMLHFMSYGVDCGRRGWLEKEDVINTFSIERLRKILSKQAYRS